jgi:pimeloyl-ACP methyl ester carboxylesterase/membrane protein DedA with SNARE-associated domain
VIGAEARARARAWLRRRWWVVYLVLLAASQAAQWLGGPWYTPLASSIGSPSLDIPAMGDDGPVGERRSRVTYLEWRPPVGAERPVPVVLLHGSPGQALDYARLGPVLAEHGYRAIAIDLPGFGNSAPLVPSYSIKAYAHSVLAVIGALGVERAHVVGWSNGGGVALWMAELAPERLESLTLMASVGLQETEGSGDYYFEHFKYALAYAGVVVLPEVIPHFGLMGDFGSRHAFARNFWDTDQRPLEGIMRRVTTPTLILHGRDDFLTPAWAAERHHEVMAKSRLIMLPSRGVFPAGHFIPFLRADEATLHLSMFFQEVEDDSFGHRLASGESGEVFEMEPYRNPLGVVGERLDGAVRGEPWWAVAVILSALVVAWPPLGVAAAGYFVGRHQLDLGVAMTGVFGGLLAEAAAFWGLGRWRRHAAWNLPIVRQRVGLVGGRASEVDWSRRFGLVESARSARPLRLGIASRFQPWARAEAPLAAGVLRATSARLVVGILIGSLLWAIVMMIAGMWTSSRLALLIGGLFEGGWSYAGIVAGVLLAILVLNVIQHLMTWTGRQRIKAKLSRMRRYEFWPSWVFYIPLVPWVAWLSIRHRGVMTFSCCNPGIEGGGGIVGESKARIYEGLSAAGERVLEAHLIDEGPTAQERTLQVKHLLESRPGLRGPEAEGFPVILKPDGGQRGYAVRLARDYDDVLEYFQEMTRAAVVQKYHEGPREAGALWVRDAESVGAQRTAGRGAGPAVERERAGRIFSVVRKEFPHVTGDGRRTLEELIYRHPRLRCQAGVFLTRFADERSRVLGAGETLRLAMAGNHCQGTLFRDGEELATEGLARAIDEIAREFPGRDGRPGGLDFGRFDFRYTSDEELMAGRGIGVVELNGTTSESTNLYDPGKNIFWAYGVLFRQWATLYRLGAVRRRAGVRPLGVFEMFGTMRGFYRGRPGSSVSD